MPLPNRARIAVNFGPVPQIKLQQNIGRIQIGQNPRGLIVIIQKVAGHIIDIHRL